MYSTIQCTIYNTMYFTILMYYILCHTDSWANTNRNIVNLIWRITYKIELSVPDELSDITLGQYQKYLKILDQNKDDDNAAEFINMKTIEIFCNVDFKRRIEDSFE